MADEPPAAPSSGATFEEKVEVLSYLLEKEGVRVSSKLRPITRANLNDDVPLSFAQERLWFLEQLEPGKSLYNICRVERLSGDLDNAALIKSIAEITRRHEILCTTFSLREDRPVQIFAREDNHLPVTSDDVGPSRRPAAVVAAIDLSGMAAEAREIAAFKLVVCEARAPFDLVHGPVFRASLVRLSPGDHLLIVTVHQIAYDWRSHELFAKELTHLYCASLAGDLPLLPDLSIQYADFAAWQRNSLPQDVLDSQLTFWKRRLSGASPILELPTDHPRPSIQSFRGARRGLDLGRVLTSAVKTLSRDRAVTLFMTLVAAFQILLYRYSGQDDFIIGFPSNSRTHPELENLIGFFANTLLLRSDSPYTGTFRDLLHHVRDETINAVAHQEVPFERLVDELRLPRDLGRNPLFQVMFIFHDAPASGFEPPGLTSEVLELDSGTSKFDLTLSLVDKKDSLTGYVEYSTDLFDHSTIERMIGHFQALLERVVSNPNQLVSHLELITESERHRLLIEWNATNADYPGELCIHELFEAQVERTPEAVALEFEEKKLTYRELNCRANQLAHHLRDLGIGPEKLVGVCFERSLESVVALLGILKAGGAYVPLDPAYPEQRLAVIREDCKLALVLMQQKLVAGPRFSKFCTQSSDICLEPDSNKIAERSTSNPLSTARPENLAYVVYTSGSTGKPKGVQVAHRSVVNCLHSIIQDVQLTGRDVLVSVTSISFDIAALELYLPLLIGARVVLASREEVLDGTELAQRIGSSGVTVMQGTPSTWKFLLDSGWRGREEFKILCGGEILSRRLADQLLDGGAEVWNLYGPTETTIWSTIAKVEPGEGPVLIGRPIANTRIYILDSYLQPVPVGVRGELHIGGSGLARGYFNRPELTAEKFITDPFSNEPGARLYRTGDFARYRADGHVEFLGRIDRQVKIRGHRIEMGEIESLLNQHPEVKESLVADCEDEVGSEKQLVGYVVLKEASTLSVTELRIFLGKKLPEYMVPSVFISINAIRLTPNGKVDRNALPAPDGVRPRIDQGLVEPRTEIEELLAQVWRELLKLDKVGVHDNFFELGGHSLLATRVAARLRINFTIDLPLRKLFELPTVAELAEHIDHMRRKRSGAGIPPIVPVPRDRPMPVSFAQRRLWFLQKLDSKAAAYNIPATFRIKGPLNVVVLETALREIVDRHEVLRTRIIESDGEPFQQIVSCVTSTLPIIDISDWSEADAEAEVNRLVAEDSRQSYCLEEAPLMRTKLLRLGKDDHVLILNFHHIVCDGSSLAIFFHELATVYQTLVDDRPLALPPLRVQYADYAVWQEGLKEFLQPQLAYWKRQLGTGSTALNLPTDHPRPAMQTYKGVRVTRLLSAELTTALKELSRKEGVTLFMVLLASLDIVLSRHAGQDDIVVGSTIAGRNRPETDGLIGFFINALALRVDLSGSPTFHELLKQVREVCLDAYTHQELPFEKVVEEINPERDLSRNPLFQVMFNMAEVSERILTLPGCAVTKLASIQPSAKFDIVLHAPEINGCIELAIVYNAELFEESTITVLLDELSWLLSQIGEKPNSNIHEYSLLTQPAQTILPNAAEPLDSAWRGAIHTLVANQADRVPEQSAVIDADQSWTYSELDSKSDQLANHLIESGIQPKDIVAIYAHRSGPLVLSLLGILKAGAAFTIIDPAYPATRLLQYLRITQPKGWLQMAAAGELPDKLQSFPNDPHLRCRISLPKSKQAIAGFLAEYSNIETLGRTVSADDPAYVAFTSGSTGEPKGVLGRHGPITHFLPWQTKTFDLRKSDRFCLLSGLGYNHLQRDVFTALSLGTTLYIPAPDLMKSPDRLIEWLDRREITILHLTPALARLLLTVPGKTLASVRRVFSGGDLLTSHDVSSIHELAPNAKIVSFYGATETQRAVGYFEIPQYISSRQSQPNRPVPLGRGAPNVQLLLLTAGGQLAGIGELGELYVRSPHLAQGYVADDALTADNFIKNPFTNDPGDRLYRTGDLGRYLPDGDVEWVGRRDRRVSIRGFRVELVEIEATLNQHGAVTNSAVAAREVIKSGEATELRLFAYVEAQPGRSPSVEELRCFLNAKLPSYMVPAQIVIVNHLPLNPNGKVDFLKLPEPPSLSSASESGVAGPRTSIEQTLVKIFSQVLGLERIGPQENFFHLGGHSLLAAQVVTRLKETLKVALDLRMFFETPTVVGLARQVEVLQAVAETTQGAQDIGREQIEI